MRRYTFIRWDLFSRNGRVKLSAEPRVTAYPFNPLRLFFDTVRAEDQGWYLCRVGNAKGVATGTHYLKVTPNPAGKPTPAPTPAPEENADSRYYLFLRAFFFDLVSANKIKWTCQNLEFLA